MKNILFWDVESTGFPSWKSPSDSPDQPHLVQLAALLVNAETRDVIESMDVIIRPEGWDIPPETTEIHGISNEQAKSEGIPETDALQMFISLWDQCSLRVAHSTTFDNRMIRIALKRYMPDLISDEVWKDKDLYYCTLQNSKKIIGGRSGHTLAEAYKHFTGNDMEGAHSALPDTKACMDIYFKIQDHQKELI